MGGIKWEIGGWQGLGLGVRDYLAQSKTNLIRSDREHEEIKQYLEELED